MGLGIPRLDPGLSCLWCGAQHLRCLGAPFDGAQFDDTRTPSDHNASVTRAILRLHPPLPQKGTARESSIANGADGGPLLAAETGPYRSESTRERRWESSSLLPSAWMSKSFSACFKVGSVSFVSRLCSATCVASSMISR